MSPHGIGYKQTWYPPDVRQWWESFTKLFLSNIINHGESDEQWQISIIGSHLSVFWDTFMKREESFKRGSKGGDRIEQARLK